MLSVTKTRGVVCHWLCRCFLRNERRLFGTGRACGTHRESGICRYAKQLPDRTPVAFGTRHGRDTGVVSEQFLGLLSLLLGCLLAGCSSATEDPSEPRALSSKGVVTAYVVNYPLKFFTERIGGEHVKVGFPVPPDEDPAFWRPDADAIASYQEADLILLNGASYAKWTPTVSLPASRLVDTSAPFRDKYIEIQDAVRHSHGPGSEHAHIGTAFTTWLDPTLAIAQADAIRAALAELRPQHTDTFQRNFASLKSELNELDRKIAELVVDNIDRLLIFSHPVYQYFIRRFDLKAQTVHWEPDAVPSASMWEDFQELLEDHPANCMIWEAEPSTEIVTQLRQRGVESMVFDPCGNVPRSGDYMQVMQRNVDNMARVFDR